MSKIAGNPVSDPKDRALWVATVRDVTPLRARAAPPPPSSTEPPPSPSSGSIAADQASFDRFAGIDRSNAERLKRGLHAIEGRLDLHGLTQAQAHRALIDFVEVSHHQGRRCVLVITGRGLGPDGPGVLKSAVPRWLADTSLRRRILAVAAAQPRDGGAGALYVLLRRQRR